MGNNYFKSTQFQNRHTAIFFCALFFLFISSHLVFSQSAENGEALYNTNCTSCHMINKKMIGPALAGVNDKYSQEWLIKWIKNSAELIASGDPDAVAIWEEYNKSPMSSFLHLSDDEVKDILAYIEIAPSQIQDDISVDSQVVLSADSSSKTSNYLLLAICLTLLIIVAILWKVKNILKSAAKENPEDLVETLLTWFYSFISNKPLVAITVLLLLIGGAKAAWNVFTAVGVYDGYAPEQPIHFSHKLHAGDNQIDCNYCHHSARHSKHSGIPSANVAAAVVKPRNFKKSLLPVLDSDKFSLPKNLSIGSFSGNSLCFKLSIAGSFVNSDNPFQYFFALVIFYFFFFNNGTYHTLNRLFLQQ